MRIRTASLFRNARTGFTLVELILVMTLLIVAISMAAPSMGAFFRGRAQDSEARRILSLIRYGQSRAVSEGYPVQIWFNVKNRAYGMQIQQGYVDSDPKAVDFEVNEYLSLEVASPARNSKNPSIIFTPGGTIDSSSVVSVVVKESRSTPITIALADNGLNYEIQNQNTAVQNAFR